MKVVIKRSNDLGSSAYLMMFGYKVIGREGKTILFEVEEQFSKEFDAKSMEYLSSDFHRFDSCLMSLKKMN